MSLPPATARTTQLADLDDDAVLQVTQGGYIISTQTGFPAYYANAGGANVTIDGALMCTGGFGALYLGQNESTSQGGGNTIDVGATGPLEGNSGISIFGGKNSVTNEGVICGTAPERTTPAPSIPLMSPPASTARRRRHHHERRNDCRLLWNFHLRRRPNRQHRRHHRRERLRMFSPRDREMS